MTKSEFFDELKRRSERLNGNGAKAFTVPDPESEAMIGSYIQYIKSEHEKGLIPLVLTGSGISMSEGDGVPSIYKIVEWLSEDFKPDSVREFHLRAAIEKYFYEYHKSLKKGADNTNRNSDRNNIANLLREFQNRPEFHSTWSQINEKLLKAIRKATSKNAHKVIFQLYIKLEAICLTLNFDGLLTKHLKENNCKAFSISTKDECESFFINASGDEYIEVEVRGDIFKLICKGKDGNSYCPEMGKLNHIWSWDNYGGGDLLLCPACGEKRVSYLAFPGAHEKEKDMQEMLNVVWRYISARASSITVFGLSGRWDPLIIAFIGELVRERNIPLCIVDTCPEESLLAKELSAFGDANTFVLKADSNSEEFHRSFVDPLDYEKTKSAIGFNASHDRGNGFWFHEIGEAHCNCTDLEGELVDHIEKQIKLDKYAQLGLKSYWLGIQPSAIKAHNRLKHSLGVMALSSYLLEHFRKDGGDPHEKIFIRLAALLHDVGHIPFAHLMEEVFNELGWRPSSYATSYSHAIHSENMIESIITKIPAVGRELEKIGYSYEDLVRLINGNFGVGYLDAIINSPIDADKIDYIFRDSALTQHDIALSKNAFIKEIVKGAEITKHKMLRFSGVSALAARDLIMTRIDLYRRLYLRPGVRHLECAIRHLLRTYFIHRLETDELDEKMREKPLLPDYGHLKIQACIRDINEAAKQSLDTLGKTHNDSMPLELHILDMYYSYLYDNADQSKKGRKTARLSGPFRSSLKYCFDLIKNTVGLEKLTELESKGFIVKQINSEDRLKFIERMNESVLRTPGALLVDIVEPAKPLSQADRRKAKYRSDGTKTYMENILIPSGDPINWIPSSRATCSLIGSSEKHFKLSNKVDIYIFKGTDNDVYFRQALNTFDRITKDIQYVE